MEGGALRRQDKFKGSRELAPLGQPADKAA